MIFLISRVGITYSVFELVLRVGMIILVMVVMMMFSFSVMVMWSGVFGLAMEPMLLIVIAENGWHGDARKNANNLEHKPKQKRLRTLPHNFYEVLLQQSTLNMFALRLT